jgi:hypothetical protein
VQGLLTSARSDWKKWGRGRKTGAGHSGFGSIREVGTCEFSEVSEEVCLEQTEHSSRCLLDASHSSRCRLGTSLSVSQRKIRG